MKTFPSSRLTLIRFSLIAWLVTLLPTAAFAPSPSLSLGGTVWNDLNGDGIRQAGEPGIAGVLINIFRDDGDGIFQAFNPDTFLGFAVTAANGHYVITSLTPGQYWVEIDNRNFNPGQALFGLVNSPGFGAADSDMANDDSGQDDALPQLNGIVSTLVTLSIGGEPGVDVDGDDTNTNSTLDFGFYSPPNPPILAVGGTVWKDLNGDGIRQAGELGIANVFVHAYLDNGDGIFQPFNPDTLVGSASTDANGHYLITSLVPGRYWVEIDNRNFNPGQALFGLASSPGFGAADNDIANDDSGQDDALPQLNGIVSTLVTLSIGGEPGVAVDGDDTNTNSTLEFGFYRPPDPPILAVGGTVWNDLNGDGIRQAGEPGIANAFIHVFRDNGDGIFQPFNPDILVGSAATDVNGRYLITSLAPGKYWVQIPNGDFNSLNALFGLASSPGFGAANNDIPNDDSGQDDAQPQLNGIVSTLVTLSIGGEPDVAVDGDDTNTNSTLDFGFMNSRPSNSPPTVQCPQPIVVECDAPLNVSVTVADSDNDGLTVTLMENSQTLATQTVLSGDTAGGATVDFASLSLPLGVHNLLVVVTDGVNSSVSCNVTVTVEDTTAPQIASLMAAPAILRPITNRLTKVKLDAVATDNCSSTTCKIISVTSSDPIIPLPSGRLEPYWLITDDLIVYLRAGRNNPHVSRVYTITVECADAAGNTSTKTVDVMVPR